MSFCLPKFAADALRAKLNNGELSTAQLAKMSSEQRRQALSFLGAENAKWASTQIERSLLLKNQVTGLERAAQKILGEKPELLRDTKSKIARLNEVLSEKELDIFLEDMIEARLGFNVTQAELANLTEMSRRVDVVKDKYVSMLEADPTLRQRVMDGKETAVERQTRAEYGVNIALFKEYVSSLKPGSDPLTLKKFMEEPITNLAGLLKSVTSSWDAGFTMNQSVANIWNPFTFKDGVKNFVYSLKDFYKGALSNRDLATELGKIKTPDEFIAFVEKINKTDLGGLPPDFAVKADIFSRPNALDGSYERGKVALGLHTEEAIPTVLPEQIPGLGRVFRGSNQSYQATALRTRADLFDKAAERAKANGLDITDKKVLEDIGQVVNATTGRGSLGTGEAMSKRLNVFLFSARLLTGTFHTLTAHMLNKNVSAQGRKLAARNIMAAAATFYMFTMIKETLDPGSTAMDPRDAHWGQWKFGDRWYNVVGPYRPMVRAIAATLIPTQNPKTGKWGLWRRNSSGNWVGVEIYPKKAPKWGETLPIDVFTDFFTGKGSPIMSRLFAHQRGTEYGGEPTSLQSDLMSLTPIQIQNWLDNKDDPKVDNLFVESILSFLNIQGTSYKK